MRACHDLSRVSTSFDETNLVPNAGLLPAAVLSVAICVFAVWVFNREAPRIAEEL